MEEVLRNNNNQKFDEIFTKNILGVEDIDSFVTRISSVVYM